MRAFLEAGGFAEARPDTLTAEARALIDAAGHLRTLPFRDGLEAFFGAILVKAS